MQTVRSVTREDVSCGLRIDPITWENRCLRLQTDLWKFDQTMSCIQRGLFEQGVNSVSCELHSYLMLRSLFHVKPSHCLSLSITFSVHFYLVVSCILFHFDSLALDSFVWVSEEVLTHDFASVRNDLFLCSHTLYLHLQYPPWMAVMHLHNLVGVTAAGIRVRLFIFIITSVKNESGLCKTIITVVVYE